MNPTRPGVGDCPRCDSRVLFAYDPDRILTALDPAPDDGTLSVAWDPDWTPRFRPVPPGTQLVLGEHLFTPHREDCATLAPVVDLETRRCNPEPRKETSACPLRSKPALRSTKASR